MSTRVERLLTRIKHLGGRVDASFDGRLIAALNRAQQRWAEDLPWPALKRTESFDAPGGRTMILPERVNHIIHFGDLENNVTMTQRDHQESRFDGPWLQRTGGRPFEWKDAGLSPVGRQPQTDSVLTLQASQSESFNVTVRGLVHESDASGTALDLYEAQEVVVIGTDAAVNTDTKFREVTGLDKDPETESSVTIKDDAATFLARILPWESSGRYRRVDFIFAPSAGHTFEVDYYTHPNELKGVNDALEPDVPERYLQWQCVGDLHWMKNERRAAEVAWAKAEQVLQERINATRTFGENDHTAIPDLGHLDFTGWDCE